MNFKQTVSNVKTFAQFVNDIRNFKAALLTIAAIVALAFSVDALYARNEDVKEGDAELKKEMTLIAMRQEQKIYNDDKRALKREIREEERFSNCRDYDDCKNKMSERDWNSYKKLLDDLKDLEDVKSFEIKIKK
jgi:hypothetical protein